MDLIFQESSKDNSEFVAFCQKRLDAGKKMLAELQRAVITPRIPPEMKTGEDGWSHYATFNGHPVYKTKEDRQADVDALSKRIKDSEKILDDIKHKRLAWCPDMPKDPPVGFCGRMPDVIVQSVISKNEALVVPKDHRWESATFLVRGVPTNAWADDMTIDDLPMGLIVTGNANISGRTYLVIEPVDMKDVQDKYLKWRENQKLVPH